MVLFWETFESIPIEISFLPLSTFWRLLKVRFWLQILTLANLSRKESNLQERWKSRFGNFIAMKDIQVTVFITTAPDPKFCSPLNYCHAAITSTESILLCTWPRWCFSWAHRHCSPWQRHRAPYNWLSFYKNKINISVGSKMKGAHLATSKNTI